MDNRRKINRMHLIYYLRVFDRNSDELIGHVSDINVEGVKLISEHPIAENTNFLLKMVLPTETEERKHLHFTATSVWSKKDANPDFYETGFKLLNITQEDIEIIKDLVADFGFIEGA